MMNAIIWLIIAVAFFIGEMVCPIFFMFWFGIGAILALVVSLFTSNIIVQFTVFAIVSVVLAVLTKPLTNKFFKSKTKDELNMNGIVGNTAVVIKDIDNQKGIGEVKIHGEVWSAISEDDSNIIESGKKVTILKVDGVKLVVKTID